jgi:hypothetical protein
MEMDDPKLKQIVKLAHDIADGRSGNHADRKSWYSAITKAAESIRKPQESAQQAFACYVTEDADGKAMFAAYKGASGSDFAPAPAAAQPVIKTNDAHSRLSDIASGLRVADPALTRFDALKKAYDSNPALAEAAKRENVAA